MSLLGGRGRAAGGRGAPGVAQRPTRRPIERSLQLHPCCSTECAPARSARRVNLSQVKQISLAPITPASGPPDGRARVDRAAVADLSCDSFVRRGSRDYAISEPSIRSRNSLLGAARAKPDVPPLFPITLVRRTKYFKRSVQTS